MEEYRALAWDDQKFLFLCPFVVLFCFVFSVFSFILEEWGEREGEAPLERQGTPGCLGDDYQSGIGLGKIV